VVDEVHRLRGLAVLWHLTSDWKGKSDVGVDWR
jgi:hypothetical protein